MREGLFITKSDFNQLMKRIEYLENYIKISLQEKVKPKWLTQQEAMQEIGCKTTKLKSLRLTGVLVWRYSGNGKGIRISTKSVNEYIESKSTGKL